MANGRGVLRKLVDGLTRRKPPGEPGKPPPVVIRTQSGARQASAPSFDAEFEGVRVEYNPELDGEADPGEVVWTWVPWEEDPTQGKDRPVVIIGRRATGMLVGVPLTSKQRHDEAQVAVGTGPWDRDGRPSYAKLDRVLDVDPEQIRREGAILSRRHFDDVAAGLRAR